MKVFTINKFYYIKTNHKYHVQCGKVVFVGHNTEKYNTQAIYLKTE